MSAGVRSLLEELMTEHGIKVVAFKEGDWWVAQCLDYDIATQARTLPDLVGEVERILMAHWAVGAQEGVEPFANLPRAPRRFWELYEAARLKIEPVAPSPLAELPRPKIDLRAA
jgi:hypothetical protein